MFATPERTIKTPGPEHPITIARNPLRVVVSVDGRVIADTREALTLREAHFGTVHYIPRKDVKMSLLERTSHATYCPYKGECNYYSIPAGGERSVNAVWTYESPYDPVAQIKDHVAFYLTAARWSPQARGLHFPLPVPGSTRAHHVENGSGNHPPRQ